FKVQLRTVRIRAPEFSDRLSALDRLLLGDQHFTVVRVRGDEVVAMAHDYQISIAAHCTANVDDFTIGCSVHRCTFVARDIDPLVARIVEGLDDLAGSRPNPWQRGRWSA